ncbi:OmpH family outer membrane protein [Sulfitobacter sp. S223]|uniref:OmpH family outer membrane protein n=1 Tax=Sulfitobacter sp. S223 TaxID=2867023 RepID=UPI0021A6E605|nr:OmpH family outer membrane protein [Sulfitobacter sp. S223]UWR24771.1 OmpH family outer membrane protein [Sulfitobacter sp. S223]
MRRALHCLVFGLGLLFAVPASAQVLSIAETPVLTIDSERLFLNSDFGKRVAREIEEQGNQLATENRQIEAELAEAEQDLTNKRKTMTPEAFRPLADAFDTRVQTTRQAQAAKSRALNSLLEQEREVFLNAAGPVLEALMQEVGASVVLERRTVFISANSTDITAAAIARLNETLGEGDTNTPEPKD